MVLCRRIRENSGALGNSHQFRYDFIQRLPQTHHSCASADDESQVSIDVGRQR